MEKHGFVVVTHRGGHLSDALLLLEQMRIEPRAIVACAGPEMPELRRRFRDVRSLPSMFGFVRNHRFLDPIGIVANLAVSVWYALRLRPATVVSFGLSNVVAFCYVSRLLGAGVIHVECLNRVRTPSVTGRLLYPVADRVYVQWPELLEAYGPKAEYAGWIL